MTDADGEDGPAALPARAGARRAGIRLALGPVAVACAIQVLSSGTLTSRTLLLPLRAVELGAGQAQVGLLFATWTVMTAATSIPSAAAIERWGLRRVLAAALSVYLLSQALPGLVDHLAALVVSMALGGAAAALAQNGLMSWLTGEAAAAGRSAARSLGWYTLSMQLGQTLGPSAAGLLLTWLTTPQAFVVTALGIVPCFLFLAWGPRRSPAGVAARGLGHRLLEVVRTPGVVWIAVAFLSTGMAWGTFQSTYALFATTDLRLSAATVGLLIGVSAVSGAASRLPWSWLLGRMPGREPLALVLGSIGVGVALVLMPHARGAFATGVLTASLTPLVAVGQLAAAVALASAVPGAARTSALSVYTLVYNVGWGAGAVAFAPVMQAGYLPGFTTAGLACGALALAGGAGLLRRRRAGTRGAAAE